MIPNRGLWLLSSATCLAVLAGCGSPPTQVKPSKKTEEVVQEIPKETGELEKYREMLRPLGHAVREWGNQSQYKAGWADPRTDKPILSWRVAILPFLGRSDLFKEFKVDQPWDGPDNLKLLSQMPDDFKPVRGRVEEGHTFLRAFVGNQTLIPHGKPNQKGTYDGVFSAPILGLPFDQITDGTSLTVVALEGAEAVPWTRPDDWVYDPKKPLPKLGRQFANHFAAIFCDGRVSLLEKNLPEATMRAIITAQGGERIHGPDVGAPDFRKIALEEFAAKRREEERVLSPDEYRQMLPEIPKNLRSVESGDRIKAFKALIAMSPQLKEAWPILVETIKSQHAANFDPLEIDLLAEGFARFGDEAVAALMELLPRPASVLALEKLGPKAAPAVPNLIKQIPRASRTFTGPIPIIRAIAAAGPAAKESGPALIQMYKDQKADPKLANDFARTVRQELLRAVIRITPQDEFAIGELKASLNDEAVQLSAACELARLNPTDEAAVDRLIALTRQRRFGYEFLGELGPAAKKAVPFLSEELLEAGQNRDIQKYQTTAGSLVKIDPEAAAPVLVKTLGVTDFACGRIGTRLLGQMGAKAKPMVPALEELSEKKLDDLALIFEIEEAVRKIEAGK